MEDFRFDPISFVIGLVSGFAVSFVLYRVRHWLGSMRRGAGERAESARRYATRTADNRYTLDIIRQCQQYHVAGQLTSLSNIVIEPRFIQGMESYDTTGERKIRDVFRVLPMVHRFPVSYAAYNVKTVKIRDLGAGETHLALLGLPGSGRSTALSTIALWAMGEIEFDDPEDIVQLAIEEEEAELDEKMREIRRKERAEIQTRALEQIAAAQEQASAALSAEEAVAREAINLHRLMPILVDLADIIVDPVTEAKLDPAEPLVRAIQHNLRRITSITVPRYVYNRLNSGQALVLLDGFDELSATEQEMRLAWLARFLESYPDCMVIVAGPATGYHQLQNIGLTPMFLRPWTDLDMQEYAQKWAETWPEAFKTGRNKLATPPDERTIEVVTSRARGLLPLDMTTRIITSYLRNEEEVENLSRWDWYADFVRRDFYVKEFADNEELAEEALYMVAEVAAQVIQAGPISGEQLRTHFEDVMRRVEGEGDKAKEYYLLNIDRFIKKLVASGLLHHHINNHFSFSHPLIAAFLASTTITAPEGAFTLPQVVDDPTWKHALPFAVAQAPSQMTNQAVVKFLTHEPDLLFTNLFDLAAWIPDAPAEAPWRGEVFKRYAAALIAPTQFPVLREWAMAALVATRDPNTLFIFRQALRATDTYVRLLGCVGLGAFGDPEAVRDLRPMLEDDDLDVQLAAGLALGAISTENALEVMVEGLLTGEENLRQAVSEAMAAIPGQGHQLLHRAATSEDMMVRRASIFGLARIGTPWALTDLYRRLLEDDQWYIRSAAEQAFAEAQSGTLETIQTHPPLETIAWITEQVVLPELSVSEDTEGEENEAGPVITDEMLYQTLLQMLGRGATPIRIASARTLGYLGYTSALVPLYQTLGDQDQDLRAASFAALTDMQVQVGQALPGIQ